MPKLSQFKLPRRRKFLAFCIWLGIIIVTRTLMAINNLSLSQVADIVVHTLTDAWYGPLIFIILYALRPLFLMPGTLMNFMSGMIYGLPDGILISVLANQFSATVTYTVSRWFIREKPRFEGYTGTLIEFMQRNPFEATLTLQLMYLSVDVISSLAGILHLSIRAFLLGVLIGGIVGNTLGVFIGSSLEGTIADGTFTIQPDMIAISAIIFIVSLIISTLIRQHTTDTFKEKTHASD